MRFLIGCCLAAIGFIAAMYIMDGAGLFIYLGYGPAYLAAALLIAGSLMVFGREKRRGIESVILLMTWLLVVAGVLVCSMLPTSTRKRFFLAYSKIRPGMTTAEAEKILEPYGKMDVNAQGKELTLRFQSGKGTVDVVHVRITADREKVSEAEFSPD